MPRISEFFGIVISMNLSDDAPPHFHVRYGEHEATFTIDTAVTDRGCVPSRIAALVARWALLHQAVLTENRERAVDRRPVNSIEPLE
jgi:hypothetical protein